MNAQDFANENDHVIVFYAGNGFPAGTKIALLQDTELPFDLSEIEGEVDSNGILEANNLNDGSGAWGWHFKDFNSNIVYKIQLYCDEAEWEKQNEEFESA